MSERDGPITTGRNIPNGERPKGEIPNGEYPKGETRIGDGDGAKITVPPPLDWPNVEPDPPENVRPDPPEKVLDGADPLKLPDARPPDFAASASSGDTNIKKTIASIARAPAFTLFVNRKSFSTSARVKIYISSAEYIDTLLDIYAYDFRVNERYNNAKIVH
jgi:hypothetical protein